MGLQDAFVSCAPSIYELLQSYIHKANMLSCETFSSELGGLGFVFLGIHTF